MNKYFIRYHIKGSNRVITREVEGYENHEVMSEVLYDLENKKRIIFNKGSERIYGITVDSISYFEILSEKEHKLLSTLSMLGGASN